MFYRKGVAIAAIALTALTVVTACSSGTTGAKNNGASGASDKTVTLVTDDSFAVSKNVLAQFEKKTGLTVKTVSPGDVGTLVNQLILTKGNPMGDAVYGIDNSYASRAIKAGILAPYTSPAAGTEQDGLLPDNSHSLTAIDYAEVAVNIDKRYFAAHNLTPPATLADLAKPEYKDLTVVEDPSTSSPGLIFLLATVAAFGPGCTPSDFCVASVGWQRYWEALKANGVKVDASWDDAFYSDFSGPGSKGMRPIVVSYTTDPASSVTKADASAGKPAPTQALLGTAFKQVEYAGVLKGAKNLAGAKKLVDFLLSKEFQADIPGQMWVYPVKSGTPLPSLWAKYAPQSPNPKTMNAQAIDAGRDQWIEQWSQIFGG